MPHPRNYAAFARVLGHYARDLGVLTFPDAVRKMSGLPAQRLGLKDRGVIREGAFADIAVLKTDEIRDLAEFGNPHQYSTGTVHVFVNGVAVIFEGEVTGARPGRALRHH